MLRPTGDPIHFELYVNTQIIKPTRHCVWGDQRVVTTSRFGDVHAFMPVNYELPSRRFCLKDREWLRTGDVACPVCGSEMNVQERERRVKGWLGLQRYLSASQFGIDFLRNGRKIELDSRDLFMWTDSDGVTETEYPIDDPRNRGRIVGEIHLDHCRVSYTKDRFDRTDPAWQEMVELIRGQGPLRPEKAKSLGYGANDAPLFKLFSTFRRSSPKSRVAGEWAKLFVVADNDHAAEMADKFSAADPAYETDDQWWKIVQEQDEALLRGTPSPPAPSEPRPPGWPGPTLPSPNGGPTPPAPTPAPSRTEMRALTREYVDDSSALRFNVRAFSTDATDPELGAKAWATKSNASGERLFYFDPSHRVFQSVTFTPLDALLAELGAIITDARRGAGASPPSFAGSLTTLRQRYALEFELNESALVAEANRVLQSIASSLSKTLSEEDSRTLFNDLPPNQQDFIRGKMRASRIDDPVTIIAGGRFLEFAHPSTLVEFVGRYPELFFDGRHWYAKYAELDYAGSPTHTEEARKTLVATYVGWLEDAVWLSESGGGALTRPTRDRLLRASMSLRLLTEDASTPNGD